MIKPVENPGGCSTENRCQPIYSLTYELTGIVQGVGFRPAVYRLARRENLGGWIRNTSGNVLLCLIGPKPRIGKFIVTLHTHLPSQVKITHISLVEKKILGPDVEIPEFLIMESASTSLRKVVIPADIAMCPECAKEILDSSNRRYGYPFTTCTDCGPRYTVINDMPYDRERTTLGEFPLCEKCREEYRSAGDRRFHAESIACPDCGPRVFLTDRSGSVLAGEHPLFEARRRIAAGEIAAIRGIGGFLLAADAGNPDTIRELRQRKNRPDKPFAVMFRDEETVFKHCVFNAGLVRMLKSVQAPIIIADLADTCGLPVDLIAPDTRNLGVFLPYSPLHKLLFEQLRGDPVPPFDALIMTSGNRGGEPIAISNEEAVARLGGIADFLVCHNREINLRNDDAVCTIQLHKPQLWRRSRGFAPGSLNVGIPFTNTVLAMGSDLKNAVVLAFGHEAVFSPHIGDLETPEAVRSLERVCESLPRFLGHEPDMIATDLHPDFHSVRTGKALAESRQLPLFGIQHHHAHAAACMAEHKLDHALALVFDGTGLGTDGHIWGAELFQVAPKFSEIRRLATFAPVALPGGDAAVQYPVRQLVARLDDAGMMEDDTRMATELGIAGEDARTWIRQCRTKLNAPLTHSAGRLFDAFAVLLGVAPAPVTYEGQAAIRLEALAKKARTRSPEQIPFAIGEKDRLLMIDWRPSFHFVCDRLYGRGKEIDRSELAMAFHHAVADAAVKMLEFALSGCRTRHLVLSGGVFMNKILNQLIAGRIAGMGLTLHLHGQVPPNDGGIALGQAVLAASQSQKAVC